MVKNNKSNIINLCTNCKFCYQECGSNSKVLAGDLVPFFKSTKKDVVIKCEQYHPMGRDRD